LDVEVGGDFGDSFEDIEVLVFDLHGAEAGAHPSGQEADVHMIDDAFGLAIEDRADLRGIGPGDGEVGVEDIPAVVGGLGGDGVLFAFPMEDSGVLDAVGEVFVGFELLEGCVRLGWRFSVGNEFECQGALFFSACACEDP